MTRNPRPPLLEELEAAASRLRPIEREVLLLSAREGLRYEEIAERLGLTVAAVEDHLADSLYRLDRELERRNRPRWKLW